MHPALYINDGGRSTGSPLPRRLYALRIGTRLRAVGRATLDLLCGAAVATLAAALLVGHRLLFFVLVLLRLVVHPVCEILSSLGLLATLIVCIVQPAGWETAALRFGGFSLALFIAGWLYDSLILWLSPEPMLLGGRFSDE